MQASAGFLEILMVFLLGGGSLNLPVGLPPQAQDPKMSQVAPEQALIYMSWAGTADADPKSSNATERMLADPQVKFLLSKLEEAIVGVMKAEMRREEEQTLLKHGHLLIKQMLLRPTTIYLSKADLFNDVPTIEAGLVVNFGKDAAAAKMALEALEAMIAREMGAQFEVMPAKDGGLRRIPIPDGEAPLVAWGFEGDYLMLAVGKETAARLRPALTAGKVPAWLTEVKTKLAPKRLSSITYIDTAQILKQFGPMLASEMMGGPEAKQMFDRVISTLGLNKTKYFAATTGFDDVKFISRSLLALEPDAAGLFSLMPKQGLSGADLGDVPRDADLAFVAKINPSLVFEQIVGMIKAIEPRAHEEMMRGMAEAEEELGFRVKEDLWDSVGDVWSIYNSPSDGGLVITGLTGVVQVKDAAKAQKVIDKLEQMFNQEFNRAGRVDPAMRNRRRYELKTLMVGEHKVRYVNVVGDDWVVSPAWCLTKDRFVISLYPQMVRSYLARTSDKQAGSLADLPQVKAQFGNAGGPAMLTYVDTPELFKKFYPLAHGGATLLLAELQREGFDMDITALPTASAILPYLSPDTGTVRRNADGIFSEAHQSVPLGSAGAAIPLVFGMVMMPMAASRSIHQDHAFDEPRAEAVPLLPPAPAVPRTTAAKRTMAMNDLRQIGIAIFVYHTEKNATAASLADLKPYLGKEINTDPWGQPYVYYGKNLAPAGKDAAKTPFASTNHLINGSRIVLYGDARVEAVAEKDFKKQMEDAKLPYKAAAELKEEDDGKGKSYDKTGPGDKGKTYEKYDSKDKAPATRTDNVKQRETVPADKE